MKCAGTLLSFLLLAGCSSHTAWQLSAGHPQPAAQVQIHSTGGIAAVLGLAIVAGSVYEVTRGGLSYGAESARPPEMAPDRRVNEVDCSKPFDPSLGNIRCK